MNATELQKMVTGVVGRLLSLLLDVVLKDCMIIGGIVTEHALGKQAKHGR